MGQRIGPVCLNSLLVVLLADLAALVVNGGVGGRADGLEGTERHIDIHLRFFVNQY